MDIILAILDILAHEKDPHKTTLQALSQTCRSMVPLCRRHLFASLDHSGFDEFKARRLSNLLSSNPDIACYVKNLTYHVRPLTVSEHDNRILEVLHRYSSLRSISLYAQNRADWNKLPEPANSLLISLIQLPTITHLKFHSFRNFPVTILSQCASLIDLEVETVTESARSVVDRVNARSKIPAPISLTSKEGSQSAIAACLKPAGPNIAGPIIDFSHLQKASFYIRTLPSAYHFDCAFELLKMTGKLQFLYMKVIGPVGLEGLGACLAANAHRTLRSARFFLLVTGDYYDPLCGLNLALKRIAGNNVLVELDLNTTVSTNCWCRTDSDDWSNLDTVLTEPGAFPMLRQVAIKLTWSSWGRNEDEIKNIMNKLTEDRFPRLLESTTVKFEFCEEHIYLIQFKAPIFDQ